MKIGIDIRGLQSGHGMRGVGKYIVNLVEGLSKIDHQNEYILIVFSNFPVPDWLEKLPPNFRLVKLSTRPIEYGYKSRIPRAWLGYQMFCQWENKRRLQNLARNENLDVIHLTVVVNRLYYSDGKFNCYVVKTLYDLIPLAMPEDFTDKWSFEEKFVYKQQIESLGSANVIVAISNSAREDAINFLSLPPDKVETILCCVSENFVPVSDDDRLKECLTRCKINSPYFLFCSASGANKNHSRVVEAFALVARQQPKSCQLVFVGHSQGPTVEHLQATAFNLGLNSNQVVILGFVTDDDLVMLFNGAMCLVSPSLYEGFGLPAAQAMTTGTPVIASNRSSHPEVVQDAGILVDPYDVSAIADAMLRLIENPDLRDDLSSRGVISSQRFHWKKQAHAFLEIYQNSQFGS